MLKLARMLAVMLMAWSFSALALDVNTATQAELESVKGIGTKTAQSILDERKKGAFKDMADLAARVKGLGDKSVAKLANEGLTVGAAAPAAKAAEPAKAATPAAATSAAKTK